jgi:transposase
MAAHIQKKRTLKAREVALLEGISERTVRKYIAQPREDYEKEAQEKRSLAFHLRSSGLKWKSCRENEHNRECSNCILQKIFSIGFKNSLIALCRAI